MATWTPSKPLLAVVLLVVATVVGGGALVIWHLSQPVTDSYAHTYEYHVTVDPSVTFSNVTIYLPVPVANGGSPVAARIENDSRPVASRVVATDRGPMLALTAAALPPKYETRPVPGPTPTGEPPTATATSTTTPPETRRYRVPYEWTVTLETNRTIDTRAPESGEPVLGPRANRTDTPCTSPGTGTCYTADTVVYAAYDAPSNASTALSVRLIGGNTWFAMGWTGNTYEERCYATLDGPQDGWHAATIRGHAGSGTY